MTPHLPSPTLGSGVGKESMDKIHTNAVEALAGLLRDDMVIASGGFGLCGIPEHCIEAIRQSGVKGLTFVSNNAGVDDLASAN